MSYSLCGFKYFVIVQRKRETRTKAEKRSRLIDREKSPKSAFRQLSSPERSVADALAPERGITRSTSCSITSRPRLPVNLNRLKLARLRCLRFLRVSFAVYAPLTGPADASFR